LKADDRFIPPLLDFHASPHLEANASGILQVLTARMSELSDFRRGRAPSPTDFGASEIRAFGLLHTIHTHFPVLKHLLDVSPVHPERLYATLLSLAGSLSTFADYERSADLPLYNHDDLTECFNALTARISLLLETIVRKRWLSLPLKPVAPSIYAAALDQPELLQDADVFLLITADVEPAVLIHKVPEMLIVAAGTRIDHMVGHAVPGIPLMHIARPPAELPVRREHTYFRIEKKNQAWTSVAAAGSLAVYIPAAFPNPRAELMVLLPDAR
jgi:type VI secretion system protein ImpJ